MTAIAWKNPVSGDWSVATNWSTDIVPSLADGVTISASGQYVVTVSSADLANSLTFNAFQASLLENAGSLMMAGALTVGSGFVSLNDANTIGNVVITGGTVAFGNGGALGGGTVALSGGELLGDANETLSNELIFSGTSTIAAADGTTLNENGSSLNFSGASTLNFGALGQDGTILWHTPDNLDFEAPYPVINVQAGTLTGADDGFGLFLDDLPVIVAAGATLDLAGNNTEIADLSGGGSVVNNGPADIVNLDAANFSGVISGSLSLMFSGNATLSGVEDYSGDATLNGPVTVANAGTYDIVADTNISGAPTSSFINYGLFEKAGGDGVSDVTSNFINSGTINVLSGSVQFSGGFTNNGVISGLVTQSGGVTTISAPVSADPDNDGNSDILWQNTSNGQAAIWEMNGTNLVGSAVVASPGPSWTTIGTGDFNGDGLSDILLQNTNGGVAIWEMNGTNIASSAVVADPGPTWKTIGTGDFNGDGLSDILLQNTNGAVAIWEMNGTNIASSAAVASPGPSWKAIGTGDFNGDGLSDILLQNTNGAVAIWEMNGTNIASSAVVADPGPTWKTIGTGDFNGDGLSDILLQNTNGAVAIWDMNGTNIASSAVVADPGPNWHAIGTGGEGSPDILFQNTTGQAAIWDMNGTNIASSGAVNPNPGSSWRAVGLT